LTFDTERQVFESRFDANWVSTDIRWPNTSFSTKDRSEYVAYHNVTDDAKQKSLGGDPVLYRYFGNIVIQIFVVPNSGATRALQLAEQVADVWRSAIFSGITMGAPKTVTVGIVDGWYQLDVISPYHRDSFESRSVL
jgi:hypothetical protein